MDLGRRAATVNLADVAAMGARPTAVVTGLVLPEDVEVDWVLGVAQGLGQECRRWGAGAVGGDLSGGPAVVVTVTAHGDLEGREPVLRSGARPGDVLAYAGVLGYSAAGLALLSGGIDPQGLPAAAAAVRAYLLNVHNIEIGAGVGAYADSVWRIGLMGPNANPDRVVLIAAALKDALAHA